MRVDGRLGRAEGLACTVSMVAFLTVACGSGHVEPVPSVTIPSSGVQHQLNPGAEVDLTATVTRVFNDRAFVVADVDLPAGGQIVVSDGLVTVLVHDLVRVTGRVYTFDAAAFDRYGLHDIATIPPSGGIVVVAAGVRRFLPASPTSS